MNAVGRKRVDVSLEAHARLEDEARRQGVTVRDVIDRIVLEQADDRGRATLSFQGTRDQARAADPKRYGDQMGSLIGRFDALVARTSEELPRALAAGFDTMKESIRTTGGTGHLRDMLTALDAAQTQRLSAFEAKQQKQTTKQVDLLEGIHGNLSGATSALDDGVPALRKWHVARRWAFGAGIAGTLLLLLGLSFVLAGTGSARWYATRLMGVTNKGVAGAILAGNGELAAPLMAETAGLLQDRKFRDSYNRCVDRAKKQAVPYTSCPLTLPTIKAIDR